MLDEPGSAVGGEAVRRAIEPNDESLSGQDDHWPHLVAGQVSPPHLENGAAALSTRSVLVPREVSQVDGGIAREVVDQSVDVGIQPSPLELEV